MAKSAAGPGQGITKGRSPEYLLRMQREKKAKKKRAAAEVKATVVKLPPGGCFIDDDYKRRNAPRVQRKGAFVSRDGLVTWTLFGNTVGAVVDRKTGKVDVRRVGEAG